MLHPGGDGEVVRQVLGNHPLRNLGRLPPVEPEDQVAAVPPAVGQQGRRPVGGGARCRQQVGAA